MWRVVNGEFGMELDQIIFFVLSFIVRGLKAYKMKFFVVNSGHCLIDCIFDDSLNHLGHQRSQTRSDIEADLVRQFAKSFPLYA